MDEVTPPLRQTPTDLLSVYDQLIPALIDLQVAADHLGTLTRRSLAKLSFLLEEAAGRDPLEMLMGDGGESG